MGERKRKESPPHQWGFTILEVIVVLALMGLIAAIAGPRIGSGMRGTESRTSIRKFAAALRAARMTAVSQKAQVLVVAELGENNCEFKVRQAGQRRKTGMSSEIEQTSGSETGRMSSYLPEIFQQPFELAGDVRFLEFKRQDTNDRTGRAAVMFLPHGNSTGGSFIIGREDGPFHEVIIDAVTGRVHTRWIDS
ncbi:prepilin-type N-terminal cleavage/methylation domain-containing protein [bacterium]|nr:prepilin-type N-terminal cleavage/methylation domain-containing protein [candidate division CSSED10-310 bacterium]